MNDDTAIWGSDPERGAREYQARKAAEPPPKPKPYSLVSAADLLTREFKPPKWAVPDLVPEGLAAILAGKPKTGKSWLALDFALAVAAGSHALGNLKCDEGDVLMLALEEASLSTRLPRRDDLRRGFDATHCRR